MSQRADTAIILTLLADKISIQPILGTGGWLPPDEREELDWLTLITLLGWKVQLSNPDQLKLTDIDEHSVKWVIMTGDPDEISIEAWERILLIVQTKKLLFISRAGKRNKWLANQFGIYLAEKQLQSAQLEYNSDGFSKRWDLSGQLLANELEINKDCDTLVKYGDACIVASVKRLEGKFLFLSFHPSKARDAEPAFTALLKNLLIRESQHPVAWFDWENTLILRMDDPGSAQAAHDNSMQHTKLREEEWAIIGEELFKRNARMTLAYVPGWVDDGNYTKGELVITGQQVVRLPGTIYPSQLVKYVMSDLNNAPLVFDYESEFRGIQNLRSKGLVEAELHGYTHMHPDRKSWAIASDRYDNRNWYREFGRVQTSYINQHPHEEHPLHAGIQAYREAFKQLPSTLIFPGEQFTNDALERAMDAGLKIIGSYYLGMRVGQKLCWNQHVCSPYLDTASPHWFEREVPVVGYFHDFDLRINGIDWFAHNLNAWQNAGAKFFMDFRELTSILSHNISIEKSDGEYLLNLTEENNTPLIKPLRVGIYIPESKGITKQNLENGQKSQTIRLGEFEEIISH